jgi:predicted  nucleic acid-binding Zn-ribbon protein
MPEFTFAALSTFLDQVRRFVTDVNEEKARTDERYQDALQSLLTALRRTRSYLRRLDQGEDRDLSAERELASAWDKAAMRLHPLSEDVAKDLQQRALLKGFYWTNPDDWDPSEAETAKIKIDNVFDKIQKLAR